MGYSPSLQKKDPGPLFSYHAWTIAEPLKGNAYEIYDVGMINNVAFLIQTGYLKKPVYLQFVMGILAGIRATPQNLIFLVVQAPLKKSTQTGSFAFFFAPMLRCKNFFLKTPAGA